jgi:hypothetical protein
LFKPPIFCVSVSALSSVANICVFMFPYGLCLLPAQFCCVIIYVRKFESHVHIVSRCSSGKIASGADNCLIDAAISVDGYLPQIPRRASMSYYIPNKRFVEGQFNLNTQSLILE